MIRQLHYSEFSLNLNQLSSMRLRFYEKSKAVFRSFMYKPQVVPGTIGFHGILGSEHIAHGRSAFIIVTTEFCYFQRVHREGFISNLNTP